MSNLLTQIQRGLQSAPRRSMLYGTHGVGKSTFGAMSEKPVFIQTEDGLGGIDCERFPLAERFAEVINALAALYSEEHAYRTVVIDSLDWLERLIWIKVAEDRGVESIEDIGYGKGYVFALTCWREVLAGLDALRKDRGMFDARQKRVLRIIRRAGGRIGRSELCRRTQWLTQRERQEVVDNMIETGQIIVVTTPTATRPRVEYVLA